MRGRKRTDDPTPNRARDIQRAFRARRAAHLESLEQRIRDLEEENTYFRKLLSLPPANRPALGKGPTGRGVAKSRSRLNIDGMDRQCGSPEPPSDSSSTPPVDYALSIPSTGMDVYAPLLPGSADGMTAHNGHGPDVKVMNGHSPEMYPENMLTSSMQHYQESESHAILPFGYHGEGNWPINPDVPMSATEITPTIETARYYAYTPSDQPQVPQSVVSQQAQERPFSYGHRRSNTEPQSFGSVAAPFSPSHRSCNSSSFVPIPGHELTPSPPPLAIRSTLQSFR